MTEPLEMSPERMIEALNNQVRIITAEKNAIARLVQNQFEVEKELYLMCVDRVVENQRNNPRNDLGTMEHFNQARIYCVDLYPNALK